jgi:uncharacterized protein YndB with AHSA1/START domain
MKKIHVEIIVNADVKKSWRFWNEPALIQQWAFASDDWECPFAENNLVVGGKFVTRMAAKDKSYSFDFAGTYLDVKEFETIHYIMSNDINDASARTCTVTFEALSDGQTKVTELFDPETENSEELQKNGWQSILNNFKKAVEKAQ